MSDNDDTPPPFRFEFNRDPNVLLPLSAFMPRGTYDPFADMRLSPNPFADNSLRRSSDVGLVIALPFNDQPASTDRPVQMHFTSDSAPDILPDIHFTSDLPSGPYRAIREHVERDVAGIFEVPYDNDQFWADLLLPETPPPLVRRDGHFRVASSDDNNEFNMPAHCMQLRLAHLPAQELWEMWNLVCQHCPVTTKQRVKQLVRLPKALFSRVDSRIVIERVLASTLHNIPMLYKLLSASNSARFVNNST